MRYPRLDIGTALVKHRLADKLSQLSGIQFPAGGSGMQRHVYVGAVMPVYFQPAHVPACLIERLYQVIAWFGITWVNRHIGMHRQGEIDDFHDSGRLFFRKILVWLSG